MLSLLLLAALNGDPQGPETITEAKVYADLSWLCDDLLEGRGTPSVELELAAGFIENRVRHLGLSPGFEGDYRQPIPIALRRIDVEETELEFRHEGGRERLTFGQDYYPERLPHLVDWEVTGAVVSAGSGQEIELRDIDWTGKVAVVFERGGEKIRPTLQRLAGAGAAMAIVTPDLQYSWNAYDAAYGDAATAMLDGITTRQGGTLKGPDLPVVMLPRESRDKMLDWGGWEDFDSLPPAGTELTLELTDKRALVDPNQPASNVIARIEGKNPALAHQVICVVAHYDGPGRLAGVVHPAADDNATGVAATLAIAEALSAHGPLDRTVMFLWTAGSSQGSLGAQVFIDSSPLREGESLELLIELDSLASGPPDAIQIGPSRNSTWHSEWVSAAGDCALASEFPFLQDADAGWNRSEVRRIAMAHTVPSVLFTGGKHHRHRTPEDNWVNARRKKVAMAARAAYRLVLNAGIE